MYVSKGELKRRKQKGIIRTFPAFSSSPLGKNYGRYCKFKPIKNNSWYQSVDAAWDEREKSDELFIECHCNFLSSDTGKQCIPFAQELEQAALHTDENNEDDTGDHNDNHMHQQHEDVEEWMLLCRKIQ